MSSIPSQIKLSSKLNRTHAEANCPYDYLLCRSRPFLGRKSATVSTVRIPATDPLLMLNFPSKVPNFRPSHPMYRSSLTGLPVTATRQVLIQPGGTENPESNPTNRSILRTRSKGNEYSGKKQLQWVSATSQQSSSRASRTVTSGHTDGNKSTA